jgi:hypothetical protein
MVCLAAAPDYDALFSPILRTDLQARLLNSTGSSAISGFLGRSLRGPARPAAYVDGEHGPTRGEARVAVRIGAAPQRCAKAAFEVLVIMDGIVVLAGAIIAVATRGRLGLKRPNQMPI